MAITTDSIIQRLNAAKQSQWTPPSVGKVAVAKPLNFRGADLSALVTSDYQDGPNVAGSAFVYDTYTPSDSIQRSPDIFVGALSFEHANTFSFWEVKGAIQNQSLSGDVDGLKIGIRYLVKNITHACTTTSKRSHTSSLQLECIDTDNNMVNILSPGDWIVCSMFDNQEDAKRIMGAFAEMTPINGFKDGFKFLGRIQSIRKCIITNAQTGQKTRRVKIDAVGFDSFDRPIYFDPALMYNTRLFEDFIHRFFGEMIFKRAFKTADEALPKLIGACLGNGPSQEVTRDREHMVSPNGAFLVPNEIGKLLGVSPRDKDPNKPQLSYSDILSCTFGVQAYNNNGWIPNLQTSRSDSATMRYYTPEALLGTFAPIITPFVNVPIWSILKQFSMEAVNEIYTCLRVDPSGRILPNFIARQIPFNTEALEKGGKLTRFLNLPRWRIDPAQVLFEDFGKSNALRCNFVHTKAEVAIQASGHDEQSSRTNSPPKYDGLDVTRSGLYPVIYETNNLYNKIEDTRWFNALATDRTIGGHLKFTGQIQVMGIQDPICEGDNLQYDDIVYHIEGVQHNYFINPSDGKARFTTSLVLSNGVPAVGGDTLFPAIYVKEQSDLPYTTDSTKEG